MKAIQMLTAKVTPLNPPHDVEAAWNRALKWVAARFVRGNIAAQNGRILLPEEQDGLRVKAREIAAGWRNRRS